MLRSDCMAVDVFFVCALRLFFGRVVFTMGTYMYTSNCVTKWPNDGHTIIHLICNKHIWSRQFSSTWKWEATHLRCNNKDYEPFSVRFLSFHFVFIQFTVSSDLRLIIFLFVFSFIASRLYVQLFYYSVSLMSVFTLYFHPFAHQLVGNRVPYGPS